MGVASVITIRNAVLGLSAALALAACHEEDRCGPTSKECKGEGRCTPEPGRCAARSDDACAASDLCADEGRCSAEEGRCTVVNREHCEKSRACTEHGRCTPDKGFCVAASDADCRRLPECARRGCKVENGVCKVPPPFVNSPNNQEGGCPCGCDHSEKMASELSSSPPDVADADIQAALVTIAEREDAGYITWAMITHRRRLLESSQELLGTTPPGRGVPVTTATLPANALRVEANGLVVRAELLVHGETTEKIAGEDKTIRASFRLGLEIENTSNKRRTLAQPTLSGDAGFPVSTWYVLGSDGSPWGGVLEPKQTRRVNVIGYLDEPIAPGSLAAAKVSFEGLTFHIQSVAGAHWR